MKLFLIRIALPIFFLLSGFQSWGQTPDKDRLLSYYQSQRFREAVEYLQSLYGNAPENPTAIAQLAYCNYMAGNLSQAEEYYLTLQKLEPDNISVLFSLANLADRRGYNMTAKLHLTEILRLDSTNFEVYKRLSDILTNKSESALRMQYLKKANELRRTDADVAHNLAETYLIDKAFLQAYDVLTPAIKADTLNIMLLKSKLIVCLQMKNLREAVNTGERLLSFGDSSTFTLNTTARAAFQLEDYGKALKLFQSVDPMFATEVTWYYTTLCYQRLKMFKEAIEAGKKTIDIAISPNVANYYALLGALNESYKQPLTAVSAYKKGLQFIDHDNIFYNLGLLYDTTLKNKTQAKSYYAKFVLSKIDREKYKKELEYANFRLVELKN